MTLKSRIIPCLILSNNGLIKTKQFKFYKYLGDPINIIKIFNEKNVDELTIFNVDASEKNIPINFGLLKSIANESNMPICYGGGIKNLETAKKIIYLGYEKISISTEFFKNKKLIGEISKNIGSQSTVLTLDVKKSKIDNIYDIYLSRGNIKNDISLIEAIKTAEDLGVGEIIINSIDRDGMRKGYDLDLVDKVKEYSSVPITILGGANSKLDIQNLANKYSPIGVGVGSFFVFKGSLDAVLINYDNLKS